MDTTDQLNTYIVRKDDSRFCVVEIESKKVDSYLHDLKTTMPQSSWRIEPRFPVCGAD
jgi:hypothetical protein